MPTATTFAPPPTTPDLGMPSSVESNTPAVKPQLRRAVYVHVSDLLHAYNIDHSKLEDELARVRKLRAVARGEAAASGDSKLGGVPTELDTNPNPKKLQPPRGGFNLCVLVGQVDVVVDKHRVDGSRVRLAEVEVGDETGRVSLRARDDQIDLLQQVADRGAAVVLRNCTLELFQGKHIRLAVTKWGKITPYPDAVASTPVPPGKMNEDRFLSSIDLTVVAVDASVYHAAQHRSSGLGGGAVGDTHGGESQDPNARFSANSNTRGGRGGRGNHPGRRQSRQKTTPYQLGVTNPVSSLPSYAPSSIPVTAYGDAMRYPGGLHGYGYVENAMDTYGGYRPRTNAESMASAHMMFQQQYEMHHRQMQMYQHRHPTDATAMLTGLGPPALDAGFARNDPYSTVPSASNIFAQPSVAEHGVIPQPSIATESTTTSSSVSSATATQFPASPKMNPQAATFDPNKGGP